MMVFKLFRDLLIMPFKCLIENPSCDKQKCHFLEASLRSPKKIEGKQTGVVVMLTTWKNCLMPCLMSKPCTRCRPYWGDCLTLPRSR